jgi:hypothetical protein|tara:strand:+ start:25 stop:183 length:159 start_codon:yes stop_codon:yes gene_type:complete
MTDFSDIEMQLHKLSDKISEVKGEVNKLTDRVNRTVVEDLRRAHKLIDENNG